MNLNDAIRDRLLVEFVYDGLHRVAQPAALGITSTGKESLRACLVGGSSHRNPIPCWELYTVSKIQDLLVTEEVFDAFDVPGYTRGDSAFVAIAAEH